jgi:RNA-directed DNA polymerase
MKDGVGQLTFTLGFPTEPKDGTGETEGNGSQASIQPVAARSQPERKRKWHSLVDKVYAIRNLQSAWERVRANRGAPGVDGITIEQYAQEADARLQRLSQELRDQTYRPQPVRRVLIPKAGGGQRPLGIPTVRDRIVQQAVLQVLSPIFEATFSRCSHGFRPGRGCASALSVVDAAVRHGYSWVVDADIAAFFDTVDHEKLLAAVNEEVADGSVLLLIRRILKAGVSLAETAEAEPTEMGTPQGGPLSPLLANVYLHAFDLRMVQGGYGLVRYADDFVIFARSQSEAEAALELARGVLEGDLGLVLHPEKTRVVSVAQGFEFLGFHYFRDPKTETMQKVVRQKSVHRFRAAIRQRTPRLRGQRRPKPKHMTRPRLAKNRRVRAVIGAVNDYLRGWHWYYKAVWTRYERPFLAFDAFVRRRLRSTITGRIGRGWWTQRLPNALLYELGLVPLEEWHRRYQTGELTAPARKGSLEGEPCAGKPHARFGQAGGWVTTP